MLKTTRLFVVSASGTNDNEVASGGNTESGGSVGGSDALRKKLIKSKSRIKIRQLGNNNAIGEPKFLTSEAREAFNYLRQTFTKALIF